MTSSSFDIRSRPTPLTISTCLLSGKNEKTSACRSTGA